MPLDCCFAGNYCFRKLNILSGQTLLEAGILRHTGTIIVQIEKSIFDQFFLALRLQNSMGPSNTTFWTLRMPHILFFLSLKLIIIEYSELCTYDPISVNRVLLDSWDLVWDCRPTKYNIVKILSVLELLCCLAPLKVRNNPDFYMLG